MLWVFPGINSFRWLSPVMVYTFAFYLSTNYITFLNLREHYIDIQKSTSFSETVYQVLNMTLLSMSIINPLSAWFGMKNAVYYLKTWKEFQVSNHIYNNKQISIFLGTTHKSYFLDNKIIF